MAIVPNKPKAPNKAKPGAVKGYGAATPTSIKNAMAHGAKGAPKNPGKYAGIGSKWGAPGTPSGAGKPAPGAAGPQVPDIEAYLAGDQGYQGGLAALMRQLQTQEGNYTAQQGTLKSSFNTALERMASERTNALKDLEADFASRGLINSGLYGEAMEDYDTQYQGRIGDLNTNLQNELNSLGLDFSGVQSDIEAEKARLRQEAIARRAQQYGIIG